MTALWVAIAGGAGSVARYAVGLVGQRSFGDRFPYGTLAVNLIGCFLIGVVMVLAEARQIDPRLRVAAVGGFLGGFTTYSAFAYETLALAERRSAAIACLYAGLTIAGCFLACAAGLFLARRVI
jgi:CrcB protein